MCEPRIRATATSKPIVPYRTCAALPSHDADITAVVRNELPLYFADWTTRRNEFEPLRSQVRVAIAPSKSGVDPSAAGAVG